MTQRARERRTRELQAALIACYEIIDRIRKELDVIASMQQPAPHVCRWPDCACSTKVCGG